MRSIGLAAALVLLFPTTGLAARPIVAVFDIEAEGATLKARELKSLSEFLNTSVAATGHYDVVPMAELQSRLLNQKKASYKACYDESCQIEIGKEVAADHALATKISKLGNTCIITMKLFELRKAATAWAATGRSECTSESLLNSIQKTLDEKVGSIARAAGTQEKAEQKPPEKGTAAGEDPSQHPSCKLYARVSAGSPLIELRSAKTVLERVEQNYFRPQDIDHRAMLQMGLQEVAKCRPELEAVDTPEGLELRMGSERHLVRVEAVTSAWKLISTLKPALEWWSARAPGDVSRRGVEYAAMAGMLHSLNPHTTVITPSSFNEMKVATKGAFGGVGIVIQMKEGALTVQTPIASGPGDRAGVQAGDLIRYIDGEPTAGKELIEAVELLRGEPGTSVRVGIERAGRPLELRIVREIVKIPTLVPEPLAGGVLYLRMTQFDAMAADGVRRLLTEQAAKGHQRLILDLRGNPGGLMEQSVKTADLFLPAGPVVTTRGKKTESSSSTDVTPFERLSIAVLVSGGSAAAAEILAGALQRRGRAVVLGQRTFGKGTVELLFNLEDRGGVKVSIAELLVAGEHAIDQRGIEPDLELKPMTERPASVAADREVEAARQLLIGTTVNDRTSLLQAARTLAKKEKAFATFQEIR